MFRSWNVQECVVTLDNRSRFQFSAITHHMIKVSLILPRKDKVVMDMIKSMHYSGESGVKV